MNVLALSKNQHPVILIILATIMTLVGAGLFWLLYVTQASWKRTHPSPSKLETRNNRVSNFGFLLTAVTATGVGVFLLALGIVRVR